MNVKTEITSFLSVGMNAQFSSLEMKAFEVSLGANDYDFTLWSK